MRQTVHKATIATKNYQTLYGEWVSEWEWVRVRQGGLAKVLCTIITNKQQIKIENNIFYYIKSRHQSTTRCLFCSSEAKAKNLITTNGRKEVKEKKRREKSQKINEIIGKKSHIHWQSVCVCVLCLFSVCVCGEYLFYLLFFRLWVSCAE